MSKLKNIQPTQLLILALILIVAGALTFVLRDVVREVVVIPLAYAAWLIDLLLRSIPQGILLAVLLILGMLIVMRGLAQRDKTPDWPPVRQDAGSNRSRLGFWVRQLNNLEDSQLARERVAQELRNLILKILAYQEHLDQDEVMQRIRDGTLSSTLSIPPEVESLLLNGQHWMNQAPDRHRPPLQLLRRLRAMLFPAGQSDIQSSRLDVQLEAVIEYLEAQLGDAR